MLHASDSAPMHLARKWISLFFTNPATLVQAMYVVIMYNCKSNFNSQICSEVTGNSGIQSCSSLLGLVKGP